MHTVACHATLGHAPSQVLQCMHSRSIVFFGDSMVRQLFNRLVYLFRGQVGAATALERNQPLFPQPSVLPHAWGRDS